MDETPDGTLSEAFPTIDSLIEHAHRTLEPGLWDFLSGGAESETTLWRNRSAMDRLAFRPRVLRGAGEPDLSATLLGHELSFPVVLAPVGSLFRVHPDGALPAARAAQRAGTLKFLSSTAAPGLEAVRAGCDGPLAWQLYIHGDRDWIAKEVRRAEDAGCAALCLTVDVNATQHRWRGASYGGYRPGPDSARGEFYQRQAAFSWADIEWLRERTSLPLVIKGITCGEDAELAVEHGIAVVYVSNHGARLLDHLPGTLDVLPEVVAAVAGRAEIVADGGFVHGTDVVKALALGATAVAIGKLPVWALAAAGEPGLDHALAILRDEIRDLLALLGAGTIRDLTPQHVIPAPAPKSPPSDWIGLAPGKSTGPDNSREIWTSGPSALPTPTT